LERRKFLESCLALSGTAALPQMLALAETAPRLYERTRLVDIHGAPLKASSVAAETNYIFHYPFVSTPCFLLNLGKPAVAEKECWRMQNESYPFPIDECPAADASEDEAVAFEHTLVLLLSEWIEQHSLAAQHVTR